MHENGNFTTLNIDDVLPNRFQPRIYFDEDRLNELAESIRKYGVIQPIVVRQFGDKYEIIAGERRYKASKIANKSTIPAIVITLSDKESEEIALLENVQRQNLSPIEEAVSYKKMLDACFVTQAELAKRLGKSQSTIANKIKLLSLDDRVQSALLNGKISERHARSLLKISNNVKQVEMLERIINERLTVKKTDEAIKKMLESGEIKNDKVVERLFESESSFNKAIARGSHEIIRVSIPKDLEEKIIRKEKSGMDIDKIMKEAKDINVPDVNKDISSLFENSIDNSVVNNSPHNDVFSNESNNDVFGNESNNDVFSNEFNNDIPLNSDERNKFINFNDIVQQNTVSNEVVSEPKNDPVVSFDSIFNQTPISLEPKHDDFIIESSDKSGGLNVDNGISINDAIKEAMNSPLVEPIVSENSEPIVSENSSLYNELVANDKLNVSDVNSVNSSVGNYNDESVNSNVGNVSGVNSVNSNIGNYNGEPVNSNIGTSFDINSSVNSSIGNYNVEPVISDIPDSDIIESGSLAAGVSDNFSSKKVGNNNFVEVIRLIRNCASEIEKLGYFVDVDEISLENGYQAIFKINN